MVMRAYVVDDERLAVERLKRLLRATGRVEIAGATTDPEEALAFLRVNAVDVLFLDIQMPGLTGFELLERLDTDVVVVFTTAYDRYALEAFNVNSVDYLLKPIEAERLDQALDKLERVRGTGLRVLYGDPSPVQVQLPGDASPLQPGDIRALARELAAHLGAGSPYNARRPGPDNAHPLERIASRVGERTTVVDVARVTHFYSKDKLTFAVVNGRDHAIDHTLAELDARLDPRRFVRIHRATIVNVPLVQELFPGVDSGLLVRLKDDKKTELAVARDRVRALKERLGI